MRMGARCVSPAWNVIISAWIIPLPTWQCRCTLPVLQKRFCKWAIGSNTEIQPMWKQFLVLISGSPSVIASKAARNGLSQKLLTQFTRLSSPDMTCTIWEPGGYHRDPSQAFAGQWYTMAVPWPGFNYLHSSQQAKALGWSSSKGNEPRRMLLAPLSCPYSHGPESTLLGQEPACLAQTVTELMHTAESKWL